MTLTGAMMKVLEFFHWFVCIIMAYAAFIPNKTVKLYAYFFIIMIMVSWIIFEGCILWDIQKKIDPTFDIPNDTIGHMMGISNCEWGIYIETVPQNIYPRTPNPLRLWSSLKKSGLSIL